MSFAGISSVEEKDKKKANDITNSLKTVMNEIKPLNQHENPPERPAQYRQTLEKPAQQVTIPGVSRVPMAAAPLPTGLSRVSMAAAPLPTQTQDQLEKTIESLRIRINEAIKENNLLLEEIQIKDGQFTKLQKSLSEKQQQVNDLNKQLHEKKDASPELHEEFIDKQQEIASLKTQIKELTTKTGLTEISDTLYIKIISFINNVSGTTHGGGEVSNLSLSSNFIDKLSNISVEKLKKCFYPEWNETDIDMIVQVVKFLIDNYQPQPPNKDALKAKLGNAATYAKEAYSSTKGIKQDLIIKLILYVLEKVRDITNSKLQGNGIEITVSDKQILTLFTALIARLNNPITQVDDPEQLKNQINNILNQAISVTVLSSYNSAKPEAAPALPTPPSPLSPPTTMPQPAQGWYPGAQGPINIMVNDLSSLLRHPQMPESLATVANISQQQSAQAGNNPIDTNLVGSVINMVLGILSSVRVTPRTEGGGKGGGDNSDVVKKAKDMRAKIDNAKKTLRSVTDTMNKLTGKFSKNQAIYHTPSNTTDMYDLITSNIQVMDDEKTDEKTLKNAQQKILGMASALKEARDSFHNESTKDIQQRKDDLKNVLTTMQEVFDDQPSNMTYKTRAQELKDLIEGSYDDSSNVGIMSRMDQVLNDIINEIDTAYGKVSAIASGIRETTENEIKKNKVNVVNPWGPSRGGAYLENPELVKQNTIDSKIQLINNAINHIQNNILKPIDLDYMRLSNPVMAATLGSEPALFQSIYQNYLDTKARESQPAALQNLTEAVRLNKLAPGEVLQVTAMDRTVFVFVTLFIRLFAVTTVETLISKNWIKRLSTTLYAYIGFYTLYMLIFVIVVNADIYRMRIIFNYVNLHANGGRFIMHIAFMWLLGFLFLVMIWHNAMPLKGISNSPALSSETKAELMYRIEVLSMILWVFMLVMIIMF